MDQQRDKEKRLKPFVCWAQNAKNLFVKVDLHDVVKESLDVEIGDRKLDFATMATGAQGVNNYAFSFELFGEVNPEQSGYDVQETCVQFCLAKRADGWWPRITEKAIKLPWLKIDFTRWQDPDMESDNEDKPTNSMNLPPGAFDYEEMSPGKRLRKLLDQSKDSLAGAADAIGIEDAVEKARTYREACRTWYLLIYNVCLFLGYFVIVCELIHGYVIMDKKYFEHVWYRVAPKLKCCVAAQFLEIFHGLLGYTKTNPAAALVQTGGRAFALFIVLGCEERMHDKPMVFYVFLAWSLIELFRYPYYALAVKKIELSLVTWLRYSMWIPLYPLGFICEGTILMRSIPLYQESGRFSIPLPNRFNFGFDFATFELIFLVFGFAPTIIYLIGHMRQQRKAKLRKHHVQRLKKKQ